VRRAQLTVDEYVAGVLACDPALLGRALTLIESHNAAHRDMAQEVLARLLPSTGKAHRLGITGAPGVGKSTFIEALGCQLTAAGQRVAVLAVDPTSSRTGGSILGDKTRMQKLGSDPRAFIRPSPAAGTLGGVTRTTRETMLVCEAAGFDVIIVETVGVGQSETAVADMVDFFLVLILPGAGDELQGIKKGILELADMIVVNKADGDNQHKAAQTASAYRNALHILTPASPHWRPPVLTCSALHQQGIGEIWSQIITHHARLTAAHALQEKRQQQQLRWMWAMLEERLLMALRTHPQFLAHLAETEQAVLRNQMTPTLAVERLLRAFDHYHPTSE
jgi:LAO/AO transport system kinase